MQWYVLERDGQYFGQTWQIENGSSCNPRSRLVDLQQAMLCAGLQPARLEARRAWGILGVKFRPVEVRFEGLGPQTKILLAD